MIWKRRICERACLRGIGCMSLPSDKPSVRLTRPQKARLGLRRIWWLTIAVTLPACTSGSTAPGDPCDRGLFIPHGNRTIAIGESTLISAARGLTDHTYNSCGWSSVPATWESRDSGVATVERTSDGSGLVRGIAPGMVIIVARVGGETATVGVTVTGQ